MTYPLSSDVSSGQPTASAHYNNLRKDALYFGQAAADSLPLGTFLSRHAANIKLEYLATNRVRAVYNAYNPAEVVIGGCMLKAAANIDLAAGSFSGTAATYYIHAVRTAGSTTFTLSVNTTPDDSDTSRVIGTCTWDGSSVSNVVSLYDFAGLAQADYDSGWFAVAVSTTYTLNHGLGVQPRHAMLFHCSDAGGVAEWVNVGAVYSGGGTYCPYGVTASQILVTTSGGATNGTLYSTRRISAAGYYRIFAWK